MERKYCIHKMKLFVKTMDGCGEFDTFFPPYQQGGKRVCA